MDLQSVIYQAGLALHVLTLCLLGSPGLSFGTPGVHFGIHFGSLYGHFFTSVHWVPFRELSRGAWSGSFGTPFVPLGHPSGVPWLPFWHPVWQPVCTLLQVSIEAA